jgi:hypothetical protein
MLLSVNFSSKFPLFKSKKTCMILCMFSSIFKKSQNAQTRMITAMYKMMHNKQKKKENKNPYSKRISYEISTVHNPSYVNLTWIFIHFIFSLFLF